MVSYIFKIILLLSPIAIGTNINIDIFDLIFFRTGVIVLFMASLIDKPKRAMPDYINRIIFSLLSLCIFNIFIHNFHQAILATVLNLFLAIVNMYILYIYLDEKTNYVKYIFYAGLINFALLICQRIGFDPIFDDVSIALQPFKGAFLGNNPRLANYFTLIIPFLPLALLPLGLAALLLTKQLVLLIPISIILFMRLRTIRLKACLLLILTISAFLLRDNILVCLRSRLNIWGPALQVFFDRPLIGNGLGVKIFSEVDAYFSSYLSIALGLGIMGLVWCGYVFKNIYRKLRNNKESIAIITLITLMLIEYPIEMTRLWFLIIAIIIMWLIRGQRDEIIV